MYQHIFKLSILFHYKSKKRHCVDPRWGEWLRGKAPYVEWLSIPNNPYGTGWAGSATYADLIKGIMENINKYN